MKWILLPLSFFLISTAQAQPVCAIYGQVSQKLRCDSSNYLRRFGEKYCFTFLNQEARFSPQGQVFLRKVRHCLVKKLAQDYRSGELTCANVEDIAIDRHVECYARSGFCFLGGTDKMRLFRIIWRDVLHTNIFEMAIQMNSACLDEMARTQSTRID